MPFGWVVGVSHQSCVARFGGAFRAEWRFETRPGVEGGDRPGGAWMQVPGNRVRFLGKGLEGPARLGCPGGVPSGNGPGWAWHDGSSVVVRGLGWGGRCFHSLPPRPPQVGQGVVLWFVASSHLGQVHGQVVYEPAVAGPEVPGLRRLGVPHDAGPVPGVDLMDERAGVESMPLPSPGNFGVVRLGWMVPGGVLPVPRQNLAGRWVRWPPGGPELPWSVGSAWVIPGELACAGKRPPGPRPLPGPPGRCFLR